MPDLLRHDLLREPISLIQRWGVYTRGGGPAITFDNVLSVEYKKSFDVATYPMERGAFESYNKVEEPYDVRVRFSSGGNLLNRAALIQSIERIQGDLKLYTVVTPERTYVNANITRFDYVRADGKAGLLVVEVWLTEIRNTVQAALGNSPTGNTSSDTSDSTAGGNTGAPAINDTSLPSGTSSEMQGQIQGTNTLTGVQAESITQVTEASNAPAGIS